MAIGLSVARTSRSSREPVSLFAPKSMACMQSTLMVVESPPRTCSWQLVHGRRFHPSPGFRSVGFTRVIRSCVSTRFRHASGSSVVGTSQQKWAMCSLGSVLRSHSLTGRPRCSRVTILISQRHSLKNSDGACHSNSGISPPKWKGHRKELRCTVMATSSSLMSCCSQPAENRIQTS